MENVFWDAAILHAVDMPQPTQPALSEQGEHAWKVGSGQDLGVGHSVLPTKGTADATTLLLLLLLLQPLLLQLLLLLLLYRPQSTPMALFLQPPVSSITAGKQSLATPVSASGRSTKLEGCGHEWYISSMSYSRDIPFWPGTLEMCEAVLTRVTGRVTPVTYCLLVGWMLNVPATCKCISGTDLLRQFYVLPH